MLFLSLLPLFAASFALRAADRAADPAFTDRTVEPTSSDRAAEIVARLSAGFRSMKNYKVVFSVHMREQLITVGIYTVDGGNYCLVLNEAKTGARAEVYADGAVRYEIDHGRREVTINPLDGASRNILTDPVHAFDFLDSEYTPALLWEDDGKAALSLKPAVGSGAPTGDITLVVATKEMLPRSVVYAFDGDEVVVQIIRIDKSWSQPLKKFDRAAYADYEWIDFR